MNKLVLKQPTHLAPALFSLYSLPNSVSCYDSSLDKTGLFRRIAKNQRYNCNRKEENKYYAEQFSSFPTILDNPVRQINIYWPSRSSARSEKNTTTSPFLHNCFPDRSVRHKTDDCPHSHLLLWRIVVHRALPHPGRHGGQRSLLQVLVVQPGEGGRGERHVEAVVHHVVASPPVQGARHTASHGPGLASAGALVYRAVLSVQRGRLDGLHGNLQIIQLLRLSGGPKERLMVI